MKGTWVNELIMLYRENPGFQKLVGSMVFNATFSNIPVISWRSVLLVEDPEKTTDLPQVTDQLHHMMLYTRPERESNPQHQ
jgi:hypothetical protein